MRPPEVREPGPRSRFEPLRSSSRRAWLVNPRLARRYRKAMTSGHSQRSIRTDRIGDESGISGLLLRFTCAGDIDGGQSRNSEA